MDVVCPKIDYTLRRLEYICPVFSFAALASFGIIMVKKP